MVGLDFVNVDIFLVLLVPLIIELKANAFIAFCAVGIRLIDLRVPGELFVELK